MELNADSRWPLSNDDLFDHRKSLVTTLAHSGIKLGHKKWLLSNKLCDTFPYFLRISFHFSETITSTNYSNRGAHANCGIFVSERICNSEMLHGMIKHLGFSGWTCVNVFPRHVRVAGAFISLRRTEIF